MKCVRRTYSPFKVSRTTEQISRSLVLTGQAVYVPKYVWKKEVRDNG